MIPAALSAGKGSISAPGPGGHLAIGAPLAGISSFSPRLIRMKAPPTNCWNQMERPRVRAADG